MKLYDVQDQYDLSGIDRDKLVLVLLNVLTNRPQHIDEWARWDRVISKILRQLEKINGN